jgi:hypothetical protein
MISLSRSSIFQKNTRAHSGIRASKQALIVHKIFKYTTGHLETSVFECGILIICDWIAQQDRVFVLCLTMCNCFRKSLWSYWLRPALFLVCHISLCSKFMRAKAEYMCGGLLFTFQTSWPRKIVFSCWDLLHLHPAFQSSPLLRIGTDNHLGSQFRTSALASRVLFLL